MEEKEVALVEAMVVMDCHRNDQLPSPIRALSSTQGTWLGSMQPLMTEGYRPTTKMWRKKTFPQPLGQLFTKIEKIMTCPELSYVVRNTQWSNTCHYYRQFTQLWEHVHHFWACQWTSPNCDIIRLLFVWLLWPKMIIIVWLWPKMTVRQLLNLSVAQIQ